MQLDGLRNFSAVSIKPKQLVRSGDKLITHLQTLSVVMGG